jgi:ribosomal protein S18 acetylase RimI-like enzyme
MENFGQLFPISSDYFLMEKVTIRNICKNDLDAVAKIHIKSFSDRVLTSLGFGSVRRYYEWQLQGPHDAIALGIFQGERLVGFCFAGVFRGALSGFLQRNKWFLTWRVITHPWLIVAPFFRARISLAWNVLRRRSISAGSPAVIPLKSFGILAIAVDPQIQGVGLGKRLMAETEKVAVARGFSHLHLTVDINNIQAIGFYQNLGWQKLPASDGVWRGSMIKHLENFYE